MPFKPNYGYERAERNRLKQAKKEAKASEKEAARDRRKSEQDGSGTAVADADSARPDGATE